MPVTTIREYREADWPAVWRILEPVFRAGETYAVPRDIDPRAARELWVERPAATLVATAGGEPLGTYYIKANQAGGGDHVCNCGYAVAPAARGRGIASAMCAHSLAHARDLGFHAMQYNLVVVSNEAAIRIWRRYGFEEVGRLPEAFRHPELGFVDALVMYRLL